MVKSGFAATQLRSIVSRVERLDEEAKATRDDRKEVMAEAKGMGFDTKIIRIVIGIRKMDGSDWQEQCALVDLYLSALSGMDREAIKEAIRPEAKEQAAAH